MSAPLIPVTLCENLRTASYIPFYLAYAGDYWRAAGLDVTLWMSPEPAETAAALLDGRVPVSWGGPMRVMMHHNEDRDCPLVCFAQVVSREPFYLIGREPKPNFRFQDLVGPKVAITSEVPTPWHLLQEDLTRAGIDPASLNRAPDRTMAENSEALRAGEIDVVQLFEPYADDLLAPGDGHIWHRFAERGDVAFTTFYTTRRFTQEGRDICIRLVRGIAAALTDAYELPAGDVAKTVSEFFPERSQASLTRIITHFREEELWARSPELPADAFVRLKGALLSGGLIDYDVPYDNVIDQALSSGDPK